MSTLGSTDLTLTAHDGLTLHVAQWAALRPRGVVVLLHGLCEHGRRHTPTALALQAADWTVWAPDLRGHGESGGQRGGLTRDDDFLLDLATVVDAVRAACPHLSLVVMGHSTGGAIAARFAAEQADALTVGTRAPWARSFDGLVLSSPAVQASLGMIQKALLTTMGRLMQDVAMPVMFKAEWFSSDARVIDEFERDPLTQKQVTPRLARFIDEQGRITLQRAPQWRVPTLLLYTPQDRLIAPQACEALAARVPATLMTAQTFPELAHDMLREPGQASVQVAITTWLDARWPHDPARRP